MVLFFLGCRNSLKSDGAAFEALTIFVVSTPLTPYSLEKAPSKTRPFGPLYVSWMGLTSIHVFLGFHQ